MAQPSPTYPSLNDIWSASELDARANNQDPAVGKLTAAWRLLLLAPTPVELALQLVTRQLLQSKVIEGGEAMYDESRVPDFVKSSIQGRTVRTQRALVDESGRYMAYITTWTSEKEAQSGEAPTAPKTVKSIFCGHGQQLETLFMETGPLWGRVIGNSSSVSYEVFSPHVTLFLGTTVEAPHPHHHAHHHQHAPPAGAGGSNA